MPFPLDAAPETNVPAYQRYRAEGRSLGESLRNGVSYIRKYLNKKHSAPPAELEYFARQRQTIRLLMERQLALPFSVTLAAVGDLMWLRNGWDQFLSPALLERLNRHDIVLGNLESPLSRLHPVPSLFFDYLTYNSDPRLLTSFRRPDGRNTFTALSTTNNHTLDRGEAGILDTLALLDELGVLHSGVRRSATECPYVTFTVKGIKFGFLACGWGLNNAELLRKSALSISVQPGLVPAVQPQLDLTGLQRSLNHMKADGVEFRILYLHWGYEFELYPCPGLMRMGRDLIAAGADLILGAHPHVIQPLEVLFVNGYEQNTGLDPAVTQDFCLQDRTGVPRKGLIVYSLGNFTTVMWTVLCKLGLIAGLEVGRDATGNVDWNLRALELVYNVDREPETGRRQLVLLEPWLAGRRQQAEVRRAADWLAHHLLGSDWPRHAT